MKRLRILAAAAVALMPPSLAPAHPHVKKTTTVKFAPGGDVTISYTTEPCNESHTTGAPAGSFLHAGGLITVSTELKSGWVAIPSGEYTIGAIKNGDNDYTMALYPARLRLSDVPDLEKMIKLESLFLTDMGKTRHMLVDIAPGHGKLEGKLVLILHFGSLYLAGALGPGEPQP